MVYVTMLRRKDTNIRGIDKNVKLYRKILNLGNIRKVSTDNSKEESLAINTTDFYLATHRILCGEFVNLNKEKKNFTRILKYSQSPINILKNYTITDNSLPPKCNETNFLNIYVEKYPNNTYEIIHNTYHNESNDNSSFLLYIFNYPTDDSGKQFLVPCGIFNITKSFKKNDQLQHNFMDSAFNEKGKGTFLAFMNLTKKG
uniref:Uncharacterized protein n=1 Tax=Parastrongyloides trichosuri TaxID=131310 RepID=A0A0N4ZQ92_PARTI